MFLELSKSDHAAGDPQFVSPASESWQPGTNNKAQAAARNAATAERIATFIAVAKEALQSPPPAPPAEEEQPSPVTEPTYVPTTGEMEAHRRIAIVYKYERLDPPCPPESEWGKHGGALSQIADHLGMEYDAFGKRDYCAARRPGRFPAALDAIIAAKGAKVEHLDNRKGRRKTQQYQPPRIEAVEELLKARYERFDPSPATTALPPKKRPRSV